MLLDTIPITYLNAKDNRYTSTIESELVLGLAGNDILLSLSASSFLAGGSGDDVYRPSYAGGSLIVEGSDDGIDVWVDPKSAPEGTYLAYDIFESESNPVDLLIVNEFGDGIIVVDFFQPGTIDRIVIGTVLSSLLPNFTVGEVVSKQSFEVPWKL